MKPRVLTTLLICSSILTTTVTPAIAATTQSTVPVTTVSKRTTATKNSVADDAFIDLQLKNGQLTDLKGQSNWTQVGNPTVTTDAELAGNVMNFDGHSAFYTTFSEAQFDKLKNGMAIEAYFKYDLNADQNGEREVFSSQEGGGLGLGFQNGQVKFYAHDGEGYKTPSGTLRAGHWVHAVGVIDKNKTASLYLDGKLVDTVAMPGNLKLPNNTRDFVLGGDARPGTHVSSQMTGKVKTARLYDHTLNADQVAALNKEASADTHEVSLGKQVSDTMMVGPKDVAIGHTYGINVHARQIQFGEPTATTMDVVFDPEHLEFVSAEQILGGSQTQVEKIADDRIRITSTAKLSSAEFKKYAATRLARLNFVGKKAGATQVSFEQVGKDSNVQLGKAQTVQVHGKYALDFNGDGIIGVGDIVKAPDAQKAAVAQQAEIKPYKHVLLLTTDGGGNAWDPTGMYYAKNGAGERPVWTTDPEILKKRNNPYLLDLFNNKFAMSTTAKSVVPAISAQNYISMLHGRPWGTLPVEYQGTNTIMRQQYFEDFGKQQAAFPSVFKILQQSNPTRGNAAFSEWGPLVNAIIEPDTAVKTKVSAKWQAFDDLADYIGTPEFNSTAMVHMQSDQMDIRGHAKGWFNDGYWDQYQRYDQLFKKVMDKLESTGHIHDTLVIANADHGGSARRHGDDNGPIEPNHDIFIALGGETIDSGRRLKGGSNADITALALNALEAKPVASVVNKEVFDKSAFLSQTELGKKKRNVEQVNLHRQANSATIDLSKTRADRKLGAVDMEINLNGRNFSSVKAAKGVQVLRQRVENGVLKLTLSFKNQPTDRLATVYFKDGVQSRSATQVSLQKSMAASQDGTEILVDLATDDRADAVEPEQPETGSQNGQNGQNGLNGQNGQNGQNGLNGLNGQNGQPGKDGKPGADGKPGTNGKPGANGKPGTDGKPGADGQRGTTDQAKVKGQLDSANQVSSDDTTAASKKESATAVAETSSPKSSSTSRQSQSTGWLPQTGEQGQKWLAVAGAFLLALASGIAVWFRKRRA